LRPARIELTTFGSGIRGDEILTAFVELEREVFTVTLYLESIKPET
jgi:hypothetical protein